MGYRYNNGGSFIHQSTIKSEPVQRQQSEDSSTHCATTGTSNGLPTQCTQQPYSRKQSDDCLNDLIRQYGSEAILSLDWSKCGEGFNLKSVTKSNLVDSNLVDSNLVDSKLVDSKLVDSNLVDSKLVDSNLVDSKLVDSNLVDSNLVDSKLVDSNLVDSKLVDSNLVDSKLVDSNLVDSNLDIKLPDSNQVDSKPVDSKLPDSNLVDINLIAINLVDSSLIGSLGAVVVKLFSAGKQAFTEFCQIAVKVSEDFKKTDGEEDRLKRDGKKQEATSERKEDAGMEDAAAETTECPEKMKDVDEGEGNYSEPSEEESVGIDDVGAEGEAVEFGTAPEGSQAKEEPRGSEAIQNPENDNAADGEANQKGKEKIAEAEQVGKDSCEREEGGGQEKGPGTDSDELQVAGAAVLDQRDNTKEAEAERVCCQVSPPQRKRQSSSVGDVVDGEKAEQIYGGMFANESLLAQGSLKVKSAANETTGNNGGRKKQTKQSSRRHGKGTTRSGVGGTSGARNVGGGSDDDDGEGRKPHKSGQDKKRPGCEGQALPKKKRQAKDKTQRRSPSPTAKTPGGGGSLNPLPPGARSKQPGRGLRGVVAADVSGDDGSQSTSGHRPGTWSCLEQPMRQMSLGGAARRLNVDPGGDAERTVLPAGARLKQTGRGLEGVTGATVSKDDRLQIGGSDSEKHPHSSSSLNQSMRRMSLGGAANQANVDPGGDVERSNLKALALDRFLSGPWPVKRLPYNLKNVEAFKRLYKDDGIKAPHELAAGGFNSLPDEVLAGGAVSEPRLGRASASSEAPHALEPSEVEPEVEVPLSVVYGQPAHLVAYVTHLQGQQHLSHEAIQELHDGVILSEDLGIVDGKYAEGTQYTKLKVLGRGSFGDVFLIRDKTAEMNIVGKRVFWGKFAPNEALVWCGLEHPNIVPLLGLVRAGDTVAFLSEYHQGVQTLQELVYKRVLGQGRALRLIEQLFHALKYLHDRRIVHKDIKPDNILVLNDHIWLIDFGLAMRLTAPQHGDDDLKGTECYMAPEIAGSQQYDERVDIWGALCTLICAISGHPPWAQRLKGIPMKIYIIATREAPMADVPATADPRVRQFIQWGLQKDYLSRPTAAQVLENFPSQIVDELYYTSAIGEEPETEPEPAEIPANDLAGPLTPWTPRGPQEEEFLPFAANPRPGGPCEGVPDTSLSFCYMHQEDSNCSSLEIPATAGMESVSDDRLRSASAEMEVEEEEDMYGPSSSSEDTDGPEVFNEGAFGRHDSESASSKTSRPMAAGSANRSGPPSGRVHSNSGGGRQNSRAALSFMHDQSGVGDERPSGINALSSGLDKAMPSKSFELDVGFLSESGSSKCENRSLTEFANALDAGALPSSGNEAHPQDEPDMAAAAVVVGVAVTSGIDSNSPRDSTEESRLYDSPGEKLQRTNTVPSGIHVTIYMANVEPFRIKIPNTDFSARALAKQIVMLPNCVKAIASLNSFTLCLRGSRKAVGHKYTFGPGEHELDVVEASEGVNWLWRIDSSGQITIAN